MSLIKQTDLIVLIGDSYHSLDIDKNQSFPFNLQMTDISNPTATKIPFSTSISLPKTKKNNDIFTNLYKIDSTVSNFNPLLRNDFILYVNNNLYQSGYFKLEEITQSSYKIRMYGGLGDFFYLLSEVSDERDMRLKSLNFADKYDHNINKDFIKNCWSGSGKTGSYYDYALQQNVNEEILSYAMTYQGEYDNFDPDSVVGETGEPQEVTWFNNKGKEYSSPKLNEHRRTTKDYSGEYRSYYQKPMLKIKPILNKIFEKAENEGWKVKLDTSFFNKSNPYWNDLWMICPEYDTTVDNSSIDIQIGDKNTDYGWEQGASGVWGLKPVYGENLNQNISFSTNFGLTPGQTLDPNQNYLFTVNFPFYLRGNKRSGSGRFTDQDKDWPLTITCYVEVNGVVLKDGFDGTVKNVDYGGKNLVLNSDVVEQKKPEKMGGEHLWYSKGRGHNGTSNKNKKKGDRKSLYTFSGDVKLPAGTFTTPITSIKLRFNFSGTSYWRRTANSGVGNPRYYDCQIVPESVLSGSDVNNFVFNVASDNGSGTRSKSDISYSSIIKSEDTCFDFLINYGKIFGLMYEKDADSKTITIMTRNSWYKEKGRLDWSDKVDYSKDFIIQPVPFDYKTGIFKWSSNGSKYETQYQNNTSKEYGSARFNTNYEFSDTSKDYLENNIFNNCIISTDYSQYYLDRTDTLYQDNKVLPHMQDNAGQGVDINYALVFKNGTKQVSKKFMITDDTGPMLKFGYCWVDPAATNSVTTSDTVLNLQRFKTVGGENYSLNFGSPSTVYNQDESTMIAQNTTQGGDTLYSRFWADYLRDRFNENNKVLTCHVNLTLNDLQDNLFKKFIFIENTVWVLNKIFNFDPNSPGTTKVELIAVQDIEAYTSQKYIEGNLTISYGGELIYDASGQTDGVSSTSPVNIRVDRFAQNLTLSIGSGDLTWNIDNQDSTISLSRLSGSGTTSLTIGIPANSTGSVKTYQIPIAWGSKITMVQIIQVSNWTVSATANFGTPLINGQSSPQTVADGSSVTFSVGSIPAGYQVAYWQVNGVSYYTSTATVVINNDTVAVAYLYNSANNVILVCDDPNTSIEGQMKIGNHWILPVNNDYTIINEQNNLSGFKFNDENFYRKNENRIIKTITSSTTLLEVFYDKIILNINTNNSKNSNSFNLNQISILNKSNIEIGKLSGVVSGGGNNFQTFIQDYTEPIYIKNNNNSIDLIIDIEPNNFNSLGTYDVYIDLEKVNVGWEQNNININASQQNIVNKLIIPETYEVTGITSSLAGVIITPPTGTADMDVNFIVPANDGGANRTITITAHYTKGDLTFTITQSGLNIGWESSSMSIAGGGGVLQNTIKMDAGLIVTNITSSLAGVEINPTIATATGLISFNIPKNDSGVDRTITISALYSNNKVHSFTIQQNFTQLTSIKITPDYLTSISPCGFNVQFKIESETGIWVIQKPQTWITITPELEYLGDHEYKGTGNEFIGNFIFEPNLGSFARGASLLVWNIDAEGNRVSEMIITNYNNQQVCDE